MVYPRTRTVAADAVPEMTGEVNFFHRRASRAIRRRHPFFTSGRPLFDRSSNNRPRGAAARGTRRRELLARPRRPTAESRLETSDHVFVARETREKDDDDALDEGARTIEMMVPVVRASSTTPTSSTATMMRGARGRVGAKSVARVAVVWRGARARWCERRVKRVKNRAISPDAATRRGHR